MATEEEHLHQFERNRSLAQRLGDTADYDWGVVALFYSALHLVQAHLVRNGAIVLSHRQRHRQLLASAELRPVLDPYRALQIHSEQARYECRRYSQDEFQTIQTDFFNSVVRHIQSLRGNV